MPFGLSVKCYRLLWQCGQNLKPLINGNLHLVHRITYVLICVYVCNYTRNAHTCQALYTYIRAYHVRLLICAYCVYNARIVCLVRSGVLQYSRRKRSTCFQALLLVIALDYAVVISASAAIFAARMKLAKSLSAVRLASASALACTTLAKASSALSLSISSITS